MPPISHELFIQKRDKLISTSLSESKDNISLLNGNDTNTILSNNILSCATCKKQYKSKNALNNH